jgi:hypothetical protein
MKKFLAFKKMNDDVAQHLISTAKRKHRQGGETMFSNLLCYKVSAL